MTEYRNHPAAGLFPMMGQKELAELAGDIKVNGLREAIVVCGDLVLDGRNRLAACALAGLEPRFEQWNGESPASYVISKNLHRRHLSVSQRAAIGARVMPLFREEARARQVRGGLDKLPTNRGEAPRAGGRHQGEVAGMAAKVLGVGSTTVHKAAAVLKRNPEEFQRIERGEARVNGVYEEVVKPSKTRRQEQVEDAAAKRFVRFLSQISGACEMLLRQGEVTKAREAWGEEERRQWSKIAADSAKMLGLVAKELE